MIYDVSMGLAPLFPFESYWWFYLGFSAFVVAMLFVDLSFFHKESHVVTVRESLGWTTFWISLALIFNVLLYYYAQSVAPLHAKQIALEFLTGFVVEKSLAIDNIFVFVIIFNFFAIPQKYQHRILFFGILGALLFRALFIALGSYLMQNHFIVILFGIFLMITGVKILLSPDRPVDLSKNFILRALKRFMPVTDKLHGKSFFIRHQGKLLATPLFVALAFIEFSDIMFAVDSVPAIFAITKEPLIVFTSNIFAILGLRSLYFLLARVVTKFHMLKYGLGFVLIFVGLKMTWLNEQFDGKFPTEISLFIILSAIVLSILASLYFSPSSSDENTHHTKGGVS